MAFERESEILGQNFEAYIKQYGGKNAGLLLLRKLQEDLGGKLAEWHVPESHPISVEHYNRFEEAIFDFFKDGGPLKWFNNLPEEIRKEYGSFLREFKSDTGAICFIRDNLIGHLLNSCKGLKDIINETFQEAGRGFPKAKDRDKFHLRSSTTVEDFVDDRYFGTFTTETNVALFGRDDDKLPIQFLQFLIRKHYSKGYFELAEDTSTGLCLQRSIDLDIERDLEVIAYSSYPEYQDQKSIIEVSTGISSSSFGGILSEFLQLIHVDSNRAIEVIQGGDLKRFKESGDDRELCDVSGTQSLIGNRRINEIDKVLRTMEDDLGYPVNLELFLTKDGIYCVQLRPVPKLSEDREVKELKPLPEGCTLITETPFVRGSYRRKGKLVFLHSKHCTFQFLPEKYIAQHQNYWHAHEWFDYDPNCVGLLNPKEGSVLCHGHSVISSFGEDRNKFVMIGVPGFDDKFDKFSEKVKGGPTGYTSTPFQIVIESDGRRGRIYLDKRDTKIYERLKRR